MQVDYTKLWARFKELGHKNKTDLIEIQGFQQTSLQNLLRVNSFQWIVFNEFAKP